MSGAKTLEKALMLFAASLRARQGMSAVELSQKLGLPVATAYRHIAAFERSGFLHRKPDGRLTAGATLLELFQRTRFRKLLADVARPVVHRLSQKTDAVAQLGVYDQEMVTYLVKAEPRGSAIFTRESGQLEAYCSGIGKVLLAGLSSDILAEYLKAGPFPALTKNTITDEGHLEKEIRKTQVRGFGMDRGEIEERLFCLAVPVRNPHGEVIAGLSLSSHTPAFITSKRPQKLLLMRDAATRIAVKLYGAGL